MIFVGKKTPGEQAGINMKLDECWIISYIDPTWEQTRIDKRMKIFARTVRFWTAQGLRVNVLAQNHPYQIEEARYMDHEHSVRKLPAEARNLCLLEAYESQNDWILLLDDDSILKESEPSTPDFVANLRLMNDDQFGEIPDIIIPCFPANMKDYKRLHREYNTAKYEVFLRRPHIAGTFVLLKNFHKHNGFKHLYAEDEYIDPVTGGVLLGEDADFSLRACQNGYYSYTWLNIVHYDLGANSSTWRDKDAIKEKFLKARLYLADKFDIPTEGSGKSVKIRWSDFADQCGMPNVRFIPKKGTIAFG